jgi:hypothetical protein
MSTNRAEDFYLTALARLFRSGAPFLIGGAYALREYGGIVRDTKDLDVFCRPVDYPRILHALAGPGSSTEITDPSWIAKVLCGDHCIDVIFGSRNNLCAVDDLWFRHARRMILFDSPVLLIPPEEMIWTKVYVQDRLRFDGADIAHVIRKQGRTLDWARLLARMGEDWELFLAHLVNFRFTYPSERDTVPEWLLRELCSRLQRQLAEPAPDEHVCLGPLLSPHDYQIAVTGWGYGDARQKRREGGGHLQRNADGADRRSG